MSDKDCFSILNHYSGKRSGKNMLQAQRAVIQYVSDHLGKPIKIIMCDHEKIETLQARLKEAEKVIEFYGDPNNWSYEQIIDDTSDVKGSIESGKRAREYQQKYKVGENES